MYYISDSIVGYGSGAYSGGAKEAPPPPPPTCIYTCIVYLSVQLHTSATCSELPSNISTIVFLRGRIRIRCVQKWIPTNWASQKYSPVSYISAYSCTQAQRVLSYHLSSYPDQVRPKMDSNILRESKVFTCIVYLSVQLHTHGFLCSSKF